MYKTAAHVPGDLNRLSRETGMLLATVDSLADDEFPVPSTCAGWTRAHVIAHLALGADALGNMVTWALTGVETPPYASREARDTAIDALAGKPPAELKAALHTATAAFAEQAAKLGDGVATETVQAPGGADFNAYAIPALRISEVIVHHADLDTVWQLEEADIDALEDSLELLVDRVSAHPGFPGVTIDTDEREHYVIGDGATAIRGGRDAVIGWLTRGRTDGLRFDGELPARPAGPLG